MTILKQIYTIAALGCICNALNAAEPAPLKPMAQSAPIAPPAQQDNTKILSESFEQTSDVISFVENNMQLAELCDERLKTEKHTLAFNSWFEGQRSQFKAALDFKFTYEKTLASLYGESIIDTFIKRDRLMLTEVSNEIKKIDARDDAEFARSCHYWITSVEDEASFFHTKLSIGLQYFGEHSEKLTIMVADPANW